MFSQVRDLKLDRFSQSSHCSLSCSYLFCKDLPHLTFTTLFSWFELLVILSGWKLFKVFIQSALLSLLVGKDSFFPLGFLCTSPLPALLWCFQPHSFWCFLDTTLQMSSFISALPSGISAPTQRLPWILIFCSPTGDIVHAFRMLNEDVSRADHLKLWGFFNMPD